MFRKLHHCWRIALGVLIVWQLFYLAVANSVETLEVVALRDPETAAAITEVLDESRRGERPPSLGPLSSLIFVLDKYGQLTEQPQRWSLFAPNIGNQTVFLAYELRFPGQEQSVWLYSEEEPADPSAYGRVLGNRVRSLEQNLTIGFCYLAGESEEQAHRRWGKEIRQKLASDFEVLISFTALRVEQFLQDYPQAPLPEEVILHIRGYEIPAPDEASSADSRTPYCLPLARWRPGAEYPSDVIPLEAFDPVTEQFVPQSFEMENQP